MDFARFARSRFAGADDFARLLAVGIASAEGIVMAMMIFLLMLTEGVKAVGVTKVGVNQFHEKKLTAKVVGPAGELASPVTFSCPHRSRSRTHGKATSHHHRYKHDDIS